MANFILNPSILVLACQIIMCFLSSFDLADHPVDPFCVPLPLLLHTVLCFTLTRCVWTVPFFEFGFSVCFVALIGLPFGFDFSLVTLLLTWTTSVESVCWIYDLVSGHSLYFGIICITLICACENCFCLTLSKINKNKFQLILVFALGSASDVSDNYWHNSI